MHEYTHAAFVGNHDKVCAIQKNLEPVRKALQSTPPEGAPGAPQAHQKNWQNLLGQVGGPVRGPLLQLSEQEKAAAA
jgi:4-hydroxy-tetrahydrodipicolinate synthase